MHDPCSVLVTPLSVEKGLMHNYLFVQDKKKPREICVTNPE